MANPITVPTSNTNSNSSAPPDARGCADQTNEVLNKSGADFLLGGILGKGSTRILMLNYELVNRSSDPSERLKIQFRAEFFNVFNWTNFVAGTQRIFTGKKASTLAANPTGLTLSQHTAIDEREIQFGLKFIY